MTLPDKVIRLLVVDDHPVVRAGMIAMMFIEGAPFGCRVDGCCVQPRPCDNAIVAAEN